MLNAITNNVQMNGPTIKGIMCPNALLDLLLREVGVKEIDRGRSPRTRGRPVAELMPHLMDERRPQRL